MDILFIILFAVLLDLIWGEPPSAIHPVVFMGKVIDFLKVHLLKYHNRISGIVLTIVLLSLFIIPLYFILQFIQFNVIIYIILSSFILFTSFAIKGLLNSVREVKKHMDADINQARLSLSYLVSRDTSCLTMGELVSATVESLTENIVDSVVSPLFFTFIFGVLGGVGFRVINTLDAMVGYKDEENMDIGWFPAKLDDLLNYIPARVTGFIIIISAAFIGLNWRASYRIMIKDAGKTPSPNSGYPMAAAAGALGIQLEKKGYYIIGENSNSLDAEMIDQALLLSQITIIFFLVISLVVYALIIAFIVY